MILHEDFTAVQDARHPRDPLRIALTMQPEDWFQNFIAYYNPRRDSETGLIESMSSAILNLKTAPLTHIPVCQRAVQLTAYDLYRADARSSSLHTNQNQTISARTALFYLYNLTTTIAGPEAQPETVRPMMKPFLEMVDWFQARPCYFRDDPWDRQDLARYIEALAQEKRANPTCEALMQTATTLIRQKSGKAADALNPAGKTPSNAQEKKETALAAGL